MDGSSVTFRRLGGFGKKKMRKVTEIPLALETGKLRGSGESEPTPPEGLLGDSMGADRALEKVARFLQAWFSSFIARERW